MSAPRTKVLLADDDAVSRLMVGAALDSGGFDVIEVPDGAEAVDAFDALRPALVILDVMMPRIDGFTACEMIRKHPLGRDVPILMLTSRDDTEAVERTYAAGATDFATKGISHRLLTQRVRFLLRADALRAEVLASRRRIHQVQQLARVGYWEVDGSGTTVDASDITCAILSLPAGELRHLDQFVDALDAEVLPLLSGALEDWRAMGRPFRLDLQLKNGNHVSVHGAPGQAHESVAGGGLMLALQDTTALHDARLRAHRLASEDPLTGLPNRARLLELSTALLAGRATERSLAVIALRVAGHGRLIETLGSNAADAVLRQLAQRLVKATADSMSAHGDAQLAHLGGGDFITLLDGCPDPNAAAGLAELQLAAVAGTVEVGDDRVSPLVHAGIALWPRDGSTASGLLSAAMAAAGSARSAGLAQAFHSPQIQAAARRRQVIESGLRGAIDERLLWIAYQPRVDLEDRGIRGVEALLRFMHPKLGIISPAEFIPIAEESGLIIELGSWVLRSACAQAAAWRKEFHRRVEVSVNVSSSQLRDAAGFVTAVRGALAESALPPDSLELELTESMIIHAGQDTLAALSGLRALGVRIALDDFGTGYSSLGYLSQLPVDCLKIDRSFVSGLERDAGSRGIAQAVLTMAQSLKMRTVGEGVETVEQQNFLRQAGCAEAQGFLYSKPVPAEDVSALLARGLALGSSGSRRHRNAG